MLSNKGKCPLHIGVVVVPSLSHVWLFVTPRTKKLGVLQSLARLLCPSPSPGACLNSCPLSWWCHPTISSSVAPIFCPQSFSASGSFPMSWLFTLGGHSIGPSASVSVLPNEYSGLISFRIDWFDLVVQGTLKNLHQHHSLKASVLQHSRHFYGPTLTSVHNYWKNHSFDYMDLCQQSNVSAF